ncbi:epithelial sodium channel subunit alpha-like [Glandiceps talaboti]
MVLYIEQNEYISLYGQAAGLRVLIHDQNTTIFPGDEGIDVPPGMKTSLGIEKSVDQRIGGKYSNCTNQETVESSLPRDEPLRYSLLACQKNCLEEYLYNKCGCVARTIKDLPRCSVLNKTQDLCKQLMHHLYRLNMLTGCDCLIPCRDNLVKLEIYYHDLNFKKTHEEPAYPLGNLWADVGGALGLWIGLSIVTVMEFFEFLFDTFHWCRKEHSKKIIRG